MTSKIIKSEKKQETEAKVPASSSKVIEKEVVLAHQEAARILEEAREQARHILEEAQEEAERLRQEAEQKGFEQGLASWEERLLELKNAMDRALKDATPQIVQLSIRIAEKILRKHLEVNPDAIVPMVEEALATTRGYSGGFFLIRVHPEDVPALERARERLVQLNPTWENLQIVGDKSLSRGGCRIESDFGMIDATLETQLRAIEHLLTGGA